MTLSLDTLTIDCHDPKLLADVLVRRARVSAGRDDEEGAVLKPAAGRGWTMFFLIVPDPRS